jgi:hypothetical protein
MTATFMATKPVDEMTPEEREVESIRLMQEAIDALLKARALRQATAEEKYDGEANGAG